MTLRYTTRPLSDRTWLRSEGRRDVSRFTAAWDKVEAAAVVLGVGR